APTWRSYMAAQSVRSRRAKARTRWGSLSIFRRPRSVGSGPPPSYCREPPESFALEREFVRQSPSVTPEAFCEVEPSADDRTTRCASPDGYEVHLLCPHGFDAARTARPKGFY